MLISASKRDVKNVLKYNNSDIKKKEKQENVNSYIRLRHKKETNLCIRIIIGKKAHIVVITMCLLLS